MITLVMIHSSRQFSCGELKSFFNAPKCFGFLHRCVVTFIGLLFVTVSVTAIGADPSSVLPREKRDLSITTPEEFFGFKIGSRHLRHDQLCDYMIQLARESNRVTIEEYATSHGSRKLFVLVITSPDNHREILSIKKAHQQIASGARLKPSESDRSVMYFGFSVHGDEASGLNASPLVAYHLASGLSPEVKESLNRSVFLLDPALNPDGGSRFAHWVNENRGNLASRDPVDREHEQDWPRGRTNYYWFDLNRDWLPAVHPESQGRLRLFHEWKPNVVLDFHEMGSASSYFFQPGVRARTNPLTPQRNIDLTKQFAISHAKRLDSAGELFFTEERFDDFYIGKGSTYPDINGGIGILFEQGSSRGLEVKTARTERTFADSVSNQIRTSLSSLETLRAWSDELLQFQCDFFSDAIRKGSQLNSYLLAGEPSRIAAAKTLLQRHDIAWHQPSGDVFVHDRTHRPDEVLLIPSEQPQSTLIQSMMSTAQEFEENIFYDVSTWHVPSAYDLAVMELEPSEVKPLLSSFKSANRKSASSDGSDFRTQDSMRHSKRIDERSLGYVVPAGSLGLPRLIAALQTQDAKLRITTRRTEIATGNGSIEFPQGSLLLLRQPNEEVWLDILKRLRQFTFDSSMKLIPLSSSMTVQGPDLGSDTTIDLVIANPALIVGQGTNAYTAGSLWHHLDVRVEQKMTLIDTTRIQRIKLSNYTVLMMPDGDYNLWGEANAKQLKDYLENGGVLIAVCDALRWLEKHDVFSQYSASPAHDESHGKLLESNGEPAKDELVKKRFGDARNDAALESVAGALLDTEIDSTHPLAYGFPDERVPSFRRGAYRYPIPENSYQTAAVYQDVISGYVSSGNRKALKGSAAVFVVPVGKGRIIVLADNPVFRGYIRATEPFLTNSLYFGPSFQLPKASRDEHEH